MQFKIQVELSQEYLDELCNELTGCIYSTRIKNNVDSIDLQIAIEMAEKS